MTPTITPRHCPTCGLTSSRKCGLKAHIGPQACALARESSPLMGKRARQAEHNPMESDSLVSKPRCGAFARSTGHPCRRYPTPGHHRCIIHGSRGGRPPTSGKRTLTRQRTQHYLLLLTKALSVLHDKPAPQLVAQDAAGRWLPVEPDGDGGYRFTNEEQNTTQGGEG